MHNLTTGFVQNLHKAAAEVAKGSSRVLNKARRGGYPEGWAHQCKKPIYHRQQAGPTDVELPQIACLAQGP
jgi:hypothetical protein